MATNWGNAEAKLVQPTGSKLAVKSLSFEHAVNGGVRFSAELNRPISVGWGEADPWQVVVNTDLGLFESMPLVVNQPKRKTGIMRQMNLSGIDLGTFQTTREGVSLPTFKNKAADFILAQMATIGGRATGPLFSFINPPTFLVEEFDVKGEPFGNNIARLIRDGGMNWRISPSGALECFSIGDFTPTARDLHIRDTDEEGFGYGGYTHVRLVKTSKLRSSFEFTAQPTLTIGQTSHVDSDLGQQVDATTIQAFDESVNGFIQFAAFFTGTNATGQLCKFINFDPLNIPPQTPTSSAPAKSVSWGIHAPVSPPLTGALVLAKLRVIGTPPGGSNFDYGVTYLYPELRGGTLADLAARQRVKVKTITSPLWPKLSDMRTLAPLFLLEVNKGLHTLTRTCKLDPFFVPGSVVPEDDDGSAARIDTMSWSVQAGQAPSMTLKGWVA